MSNYNSKLANGSDAIVPSSYELESATLTCSNGTEYNIVDLIASLSIDESLYSGSLQGEVSILDAAQLLEKVKCVSGEGLHLVLKRRLLDGQSTKYSHKFRIAEIHSYAKLSPGTATYVFRCVSEHAYISQSKTISKPFNNVPGQLIKNICTDELSIDEKNLSINTETKQTIVGVYPRMRPMYLINWLARRSYDNGTPFFFYETLGHGIYFESYENLINKESYKEYTYAPSTNTIVGSEENNKILASKVLTLSSEFNMSQYMNIGAGAYSSTLHTLDIATKSYDTQTYAYSDSKLRLNANGVIPKGSQIQERPLEEHRDSTNFYISLNTSAVSGGSSYQAPANSDILAANAYVQNMDTLELRVEIYGDFNLYTGSTIDINVVKSIDAGDDKRGRDLFLSGKYIISSITHKFTDEYRMDLILKKDSFIDSLDNIQKRD
jgi:hypothetical protein